MDILLAEFIKSIPDEDEFDSEVGAKSPLKIEAVAMKVLEQHDPAVKIKYFCNKFE